MTTPSEREAIAARWLIAQDDPDFTDEQRVELVQWLSQSADNCDIYVRLVRAWRWTVLLYQDEPPLVYEKPRAKRGGSSNSTRSRRGLIDRRFGNLLREVREQNGFSQAELALRAGMRQGDIAKIEAGDYALTLISTYVLAAALGIAPSRLVSRLEQAMRGGIPPRRKRKRR